MIALPITERKQIEEERLKTIHVLNSIAHRTSHELRAPLARILGLTQLISLKMITPEEVNYVTQQIAQASTDLDEATHDLSVFVNDNHFNNHNP